MISSSPFVRGHYGSPPRIVLLTKALRDIDVAEEKLVQARIPFEPLANTEPAEADKIYRHLDCLKALLLANRISVVKGANGPALGPLSTWRDTERSLSISEASRKLKLSVLKLEDEVLQDVRGLPAQHAPLIAQVEGRDRRAELAARAANLTHRQLHAAVNRLRKDPDLSVTDAVAGTSRPATQDPLAGEVLLDRLADLSRQLVRLLDVIDRRASIADQDVIQGVLSELIRAVNTFTHERRATLPDQQT